MFRCDKFIKISLLTGALFLSQALFVQLKPTCAETVSVEVVQSRDVYPLGADYPILFQIKISDSWYIHGTEKTSDGLIPSVLSFTGFEGVQVDRIQFPEPERRQFEYTKERIQVYSGKIPVRAMLEISKDAPVGKHQLTGKLSFQACSAQSCLPPEVVTIPFTVDVAPQGAISKIQNQTLFGQEREDDSLLRGASAWHLGAGFWLGLLGVFIGGLALNLTPCIYPLIPITVSYFGGKGDRLSGRTIFHGLCYISGLAVSNSTLGVTAALSGGMLGAALQSPVVLVVIAGILVALGLSFFGLWEIRVPLRIAKLASKNFGGYSGTLFMGLTLGVVAAPCLGPFILGLLTYVGQKGDPLLGFVYFFVLSMGLGLPLAALGVFSSSLDRLPMSGEWMVWIRKCLGWVLLGMAGYMLQPLMPGVIGKSAILSVILLLAGVHLGWLDRSRGGSVVFGFIKRGLGILLMGGAVVLFLLSFSVKEGIKWVPYDQETVEAARGLNPVVLDFYADWCVPCKTMDKEVFGDPEVAKLSESFVNVRVDLTAQHPEQVRLQRTYQIRGVPTVIFLDKQGAEVRELRIETYIDRHEMLKRMKSLLDGSG